MKKRKFFANDVYYGCVNAYTDLYRDGGMSIGFNYGVLISDVADIWRLSSEIIQEGKNISLENERGRAVICGLGKRFRRALNKADAIIGRCRSAWEFDPYVELFLQEVVSSGLAGIPRWLLYECDERALFLLSECIENIRVKGNSSEFKRKINDFKRVPNKSYKSMVGYFEKLFDKYDELLVVRLNLFYLKDAGRLAVGKEYERVARDRDRFLREGVSGFSIQLYGYAWKIEGDSVRGYRLHMVLLFDREVSGNVSVGVMLGRYWESIAAGEGRFFCFNGVSGSMASFQESTGYRDIQLIAVYLALTDAYARAILPKGARRLGRGQA